MVPARLKIRWCFLVKNWQIVQQELGQLMSVFTSKRSRATLVCLLFLCLSPANLAISWLQTWPNQGIDSRQAFSISISSGGTGSNLAIQKRSLTDCFGNLFKATLIHGRLMPVFTRKYLSSFLEDNGSVVRSMDRKLIPVRAPPVC